VGELLGVGVVVGWVERVDGWVEYEVVDVDWIGLFCCGFDLLDFVFGWFYWGVVWLEEGGFGDCYVCWFGCGCCFLCGDFYVGF